MEQEQEQASHGSEDVEGENGGGGSKHPGLSMQNMGAMLRYQKHAMKTGTGAQQPPKKKTSGKSNNNKSGSGAADEEDEGEDEEGEEGEIEDDGEEGEAGEEEEEDVEEQVQSSRDSKSKGNRKKYTEAEVDPEEAEHYRRQQRK